MANYNPHITRWYNPLYTLNIQVFFITHLYTRTPSQTYLGVLLAASWASQVFRKKRSCPFVSRALKLESMPNIIEHLLFSQLMFWKLKIDIDLLSKQTRIPANPAILRTKLGPKKPPVSVSSVFLQRNGPPTSNGLFWHKVPHLWFDLSAFRGRCLEKWPRRQL